MHGRCRKLYTAVVVVLAAIVLQDVLLLLNSILGVNAIFAVYIFFTDLADSMFMVRCRAVPASCSPYTGVEIFSLGFIEAENGHLCFAFHHPVCIRVHTHDKWCAYACQSTPILDIQRMAVIPAMILLDASRALGIGCCVLLHPDDCILIASVMQALMLTIAAGFWYAYIPATCSR